MQMQEVCQYCAMETQHGKQQKSHGEAHKPESARSPHVWHALDKVQFVDCGVQWLSWQTLPIICSIIRLLCCIQFLDVPGNMAVHWAKSAS